MRLPNVFTAIADVAMGYLFVHGIVESPRKLTCLVATSALLYTAGMVLNDVFDFEIDSKERPFRPLPSKQISLATARSLGIALLGVGVGFGWLAGFLPGEAAALPWRSGLVASLLAGGVLAYDTFLKFTPAGPLGMGACRFLNVLLGMSTAQQLLGNAVLGYSLPELLAAAGIGTYIIGVTWFARAEAATSSRTSLSAAMIIMAAGVVLLGATAVYLPVLGLEQPKYYWLLLALLIAPVPLRCAIAVADPAPQNVQAAVKRSILSLIWLDAATVAAFAQPIDGLPLMAIAVAALLVPALVLGRWVYST
jgi:4-hydroxybenzoate polyprenyltransferase